MAPSSGRDGKASAARTDSGTVLESVLSLGTDLVFDSESDDDGEESGDECLSPGEASSDTRSSSTEPTAELPPNAISSLRGNKFAKASRAGTDDGREVEQSSSGAPEGATGHALGADDGGDVRNEDDVALGKNVLLLKSKSDNSGNLCSVYIIGTAHISQDSCDEVQELIRRVKPQTVFLEICASRVSVLYPQRLEGPTTRDLVNLYKRGANPFGIAYSWVLARYAGTLGIFPGTELRVAYLEALQCGARVVLGDRPIQITLKRTWARLNAWQKTRLMFELILQGFFVPRAEDIKKSLEELKETDMITAMVEDMGGTYPSLLETLVRERDLYMTATLRAAAQHRSKVVAVVGRGHLEGISQNWEKNISLQKLLRIPEGRSRSSRSPVRWGAVALAVGGLAVFVGIHYSRKI